ncbi:MAG: hypothetical protein B6I24_03470 [Bacteroidetes bacterium 4572_128]|nr:MAG: hypothetical protein B6I24_03470 [Bacteroidetes bacterium 4572_128]
MKIIKILIFTFLISSNLYSQEKNVLSATFENENHIFVKNGKNVVLSFSLNANEMEKKHISKFFENNNYIFNLISETSENENTKYKISFINKKKEGNLQMLYKIFSNLNLKNFVYNKKKYPISECLNVLK